ncbi:3-hydroxyacyl-CoA dehydrogenase/enoyl-CoA hydratase family protein [Acidihalobacter ferrooxydans]|uniref:3-hydroxyacyl-CoA dehydrogenase n=1 Tax=Acidihalobacter ferrooxydans TaxID=1765967 RepID=A0A1P8UEG8_9GAMM|nr:3-hydroxyacyl-CoA dehydrogenase/enoyl-CoA hydratase family protein [Acidihalobacter ferrooxydans]APZ42189.1 3-hydroxyacyl-CoA dehydrogenase [Acidihalobacter ferrooxydans]
MSRQTAVQSPDSSALARLPTVHRVAVLGAGVMGAQIAAHFANAGIAVRLYDLPADGADKSAIARKALAGMAKLKPEPLAASDVAALVTPCNYDDDLPGLADCQLVLEAIAERMDLKAALFERIVPHLSGQAVLATNTSGLSVEEMAGHLPAALRERFVGIHFFNPPRYMQLVELIPSRETAPGVLDSVETFLVGALGKGVVRARDTANFIGNRIGVFAMMVTVHHAQQYGLNFETVDELTGRRIGRPKSATFRTADVVGLDTLHHVLEGALANLPDDPWAKLYVAPDWLDDLIAAGALGQKTKRGIYQKVEGEIRVYEPATGEYRKRHAKVPGKVEKLLDTRDPAQYLPRLRALKDPQAQFVWAIHRDVFHYAAHLLGEIADTARDVDFAIRWGFGWDRGPFEIWQQASWREIAALITADIDADATPALVPLPDWVGEIDAAHEARASWSAADARFKPRSTLPVYRRQICPAMLYGEDGECGETVFETAAARVWHTGDDVLIASFKTKMHTVNDALIADLHRAVELAEREYAGLVIWHPDGPFSAGADLKSFMPVAVKSLLPGNNALDELLQRFQGMCIRMRRASVPVVAGVHGLALGGGCELMMQSDRVVAALESYIGLVEVGVGLIPAGSGCMEQARRADQATRGGDIFPHLRGIFETIAMGKVATSALRAREMGFLREADVVVMNREEVLGAAKAQVHALQAASYRAPAERPIRAAGREAVANFHAAMANMHAGGYISDYDMTIGLGVANALCGGDVDAGTELPEDWYLREERKHFCQLIRSPKTHARVAHMLKNGKPLRN